MKTYVLFFIICISIFSCGSDDVDCSTAIPPPNNLLIQLEDEQGNLLIGTTFAQDSFKLFNTTNTLYIKPVNNAPGTLSIVYDAIISNDTYFLELSSTDSDTLSIGYSVNSSDCFTSFRLESFMYNQETIYDGIGSSSNQYTIIKE